MKINITSMHGPQTILTLENISDNYIRIEMLSKDGCPIIRDSFLFTEVMAALIAFDSRLYQRRNQGDKE